MNAGYEVTAFMSKQRSGLRMSTVMTYTNVNGYLIPNLTYKSGEQMAWVRAANQHRAIAEEIILKELIYV